MDISVTIELINNMIVLTAGNGKILTSRGAYSGRVYLGVCDTPTNWSEVDADTEVQVGAATVDALDVAATGGTT